MRDLKGLRDHLSTWTLPPSATKPELKSVSRWIPLVAGGFFLLVLGAIAGRRMAPPPPPPPRLRYITSSGWDGAPAISPDGRLCAFASSRDGVSRIWLKQLAGGSEVALTEGPDGTPRFSRDSMSVFFIRREGSGSALYRVSALGGPPQRLLADAIEADISADGNRIAFVRTHASETGRVQELRVAESDGGGERLVDTGVDFRCVLRAGRPTGRGWRRRGARSTSDRPGRSSWSIPPPPRSVSSRLRAASESSRTSPGCTAAVPSSTAAGTRPSCLPARAPITGRT